jgi:hypothetical protein
VGTKNSRFPLAERISAVVNPLQPSRIFQIPQSKAQILPAQNACEFFPIAILDIGAFETRFISGDGFSRPTKTQKYRRASAPEAFLS